MSIKTRFDGASYSGSSARRLLANLAVICSSILLSACGSSTTPLGSTTTSASATGSTGAAANTAASNEVNKAGNSSTSSTNGSAATNANGNPATNAVVTPSFVTDPLTAFKRLVADIAMLNEFDVFFNEPPNLAAPTVTTGQDFRYINCASTPRLCAGTVSLTRTYANAGTFADVTAGTAHAFSFQNYQYFGFLQHDAFTGTAYLTFPEGFTVANGIYQGKASLYIRLKAPGPVIEWDGSVTASNFKNEGSPTHRLTGNVEVSPSSKPTWALNIASWRTFGVTLEGSQLTITESGQSAEVVVESATSDESIIRMSYNVNGQPTTVRIKQTNVAGVLSYVLQ
jgi:hypothetical protein